MSIKDIIAFPYMQTDDLAVAANNNVQIGDTPFRVYNFVSDANGYNVKAVDDVTGRWFKFSPKFTAGNSSGQAKASSFIWNFGTLYATKATGVYYFGYRWRFNPVSGRQPTVAWLSRILSILLSTTSNATYVTDLLVPADLPGFTQVLNTMSREYYIEGRIDFPNSKVKLWVDGVLVKEIAIAQAVTLADINGSLSIGDYTSNLGSPLVASTYDNYVKDLYWKEVTSQDDDFRLGPQVVVPMTVTAVDAPNWTPQGAGTLLDALNTPINTVASKQTPYVKNDPARSPAEITFTPVHNTTKINGVIFSTSAWKDAGTSGVSNLKFSDGTVASGEVSNTLTSNFSVGPKLLLEKNLAGNRLTESDFVSGKLVLRPSAV